MRVLAEEGVLLALGTVLAVMTGIRTDAVFIAGLLLAVSVTGLVEWLHADERWPWLPCVAYLIVAAAVPAWCSFMPLVAYDMARLAAAGRPSRLVTAVRWLWVLPFAALWFVRVSHAGVAAEAADANSHMQALALTLTALLGFVAGRSREASDGNRRALLHAQDMAREASRSVRSRIADIDEERAQSVRMATLGERTRIAREIHDNVGHLLTRAIMQAQAGRAVAEATDDEVAARGFTTLGETLDDAMTMVRRSVHDLEDDGTDFAAQIEAAVASFDGISPDFSVSLANDVDTAPAPVSRCCVIFRHCGSWSSRIQGPRSAPVMPAGGAGRTGSRLAAWDSPTSNRACAQSAEPPCAARMMADGACSCPCRSNVGMHPRDLARKQTSRHS